MTRVGMVSRTAAVLAAFVVPAVGVAVPASAASKWEPESGVFTEDIEDFCDVTGLTVRLVSTTEGRVKWAPRGPDRLPYRQAHFTQTDVYTNLATGESATEVSKDNENFLHVTDNGDGTLTNIQSHLFNKKMLDEDGRFIGHRIGRLLIEIVVDHAGTPTDPDDDEFVSINIESKVKGDNFCTTMLQAIG